MVYEQYLIDYLYWVGEYSKETETESKTLISFHIGKIYQMIDASLKGLRYIELNGVTTPIVRHVPRYETAKNMDVTNLSNYRDAFYGEATFYKQRGNYFSTMYDQAYIEAQKLNIENYIYQDFAYLVGKADVADIAGKLCNSTEDDCYKNVLAHGTKYQQSLRDYDAGPC